VTDDLLQRLRDALADRYAIRRELGRGGMALVFLADDRRHGRSVALKVVRPEVAGSVGHERFLREIQVAAHLTHPHILPLYDSGDVDGLLYYVMPFVEGESLKDRIERGGALPLTEAVRLAQEVADALAYAHRQGLVHRDIKPDNILISSGHAVVTDFGICRALDAAEESGLTRAGLTLGTPAYMSPEQWSRPDRIDGRSDVYSLGCVLYEMLTGEPPFSGTSATVLMARHTQQPVPSVRIIRPDLPDSVETVLQRALAKIPDERYTSALEFTEALNELTATPSLTRPVAEPAAKQPRLRIWAGAAALTVLLIAAAAVGYLLPVSPAEGSSEDRVRVVVLPFENFDPEREFFADAVAEGITTRLSSVRGLGVIARSSAVQYAGARVGIREIGAQLNVAYVVEGSIRCACLPGSALNELDSLHVSARLIKVADETQAWANDYRVAVRDVFTVQGSIAEAVVALLNLAPQDGEQSRLVTQPTRNVEAYELYLRGNTAYDRSWERSDVEAAIDLYTRATVLDPTFALAFARLGQAHAWHFRLRYDVTESRLARAQAAVDSALRLDPELAEAYVARGLYHYWGRFDYDRAMDALLTAAQLQPANALVFRQIGNVRRRQGVWQESINAYRRAAELDPRSHLAWYNLADTYGVTRRYDDARRQFLRVLTLNANFFDAYLQLAYVMVWSRGDVSEAQRILAEAEQRVPPHQWRPLYGFWLFGMSRIVMPDAIVSGRVQPGMYGLSNWTYHLAVADDAARRGNATATHAHADSARALLEPRWASSDEANVLVGQLALAYSLLGRHGEAVAYGRRSVEMNAKDAFEGSDWIVLHARLLMAAGDHAAAIDHLELALSIPSRFSPAWIRLDPVWHPLAGNRRFQRLINAELVVAEDEEEED
jgi:eukaryotic-like serine/threonine-protein kinase